MNRNYGSLLLGALVGMLIATLLPVAAHDPAEATGNGTESSVEAVGQTNDDPPPPYLRSHGKRITSALIGYCPPSEDPCPLPDIIRTTRKLRVHPRGHVTVKTRVDVAKVTVGLSCGSAKPVWQLGPRRWVFHVSPAQGTRPTCDWGSLHITYAEGTEFAGGTARYTFSTRPHRH